MLVLSLVVGYVYIAHTRDEAAKEQARVAEQQRRAALSPEERAAEDRAKRAAEAIRKAEAEAKAEADQQAQARRKAEAEAKAEADREAQARRKAEAEANAPAKIGTEGRIMPNHGGTHTVLAVSKAAFEDMGAAGSDRAVAAMVLAGRGFLVPKGTRVQVLEKSWGKARVLVLEGLTLGREGWILSEWVKQSMPSLPDVTKAKQGMQTAPVRQAEEERRAAGARAKADKERREAIDAAKWRTWTDSSGEHKIDAKFGGMASGKVILVRSDGSKIQLPLEELSEEDQEWIKERKWSQ